MSVDLITDRQLDYIEALIKHRGQAVITVLTEAAHSGALPEYYLHLSDLTKSQASQLIRWLLGE